ncbi:MAG TPA: hypothetical protein VGB60_12455 [Brevundimonas sp.]|jgi:hypothetical protein|uniref:hypothetical protein n=1 Tax=Brevundimonas sp. TaxID=1871086 RepID=UPI002ED8310A
MNYIRTASFGDLFLVTFIVAASFQIAFSLLGVILAFTSPGLFHLNGAQATSPVGAIGALLFLLAFGLAMNAAISALGALLVLLWRRLLRQGPAALTQP